MVASLCEGGNEPAGSLKAIWQLLDLNVTGMKEECVDDSYDHTSEIKFEEILLPNNFPVVKCEVESHLQKDGWHTGSQRIQETYTYRSIPEWTQPPPPGTESCRLFCTGRGGFRTKRVFLLRSVTFATRSNRTTWATWKSVRNHPLKNKRRRMTCIHPVLWLHHGQDYQTAKKTRN
ncbi:hypothetical protein ANN_27561 [Periplaneta americana]|uniref:Uncharacterized protein n=1 Tax=Periplaneta americana TaxID=6978 RepID=A0ABQ8RW80_PERAM|nr:hypothetical protein ANN_27561 [Periplaneta americana]